MAKLIFLINVLSGSELVLQICSVKTTNIPDARHCWHHDKSLGHTLAAEELVNGLAKFPLPGLAKLKVLEPGNFKNILQGKSGIIFFKDCWRRENESYRNRSGDHIDLWNGYRLTDWKTWVRIQFNLSWEGVWSDYRQSKEIWFCSVV